MYISLYIILSRYTHGTKVYRCAGHLSDAFQTNLTDHVLIPLQGLTQSIYTCILLYLYVINHSRYSKSLKLIITPQTPWNIIIIILFQKYDFMIKMYTVSFFTCKYYYKVSWCEISKIQMSAKY